MVVDHGSETWYRCIGPRPAARPDLGHPHPRPGARPARFARLLRPDPRRARRAQQCRQDHDPAAVAVEGRGGRRGCRAAGPAERRRAGLRQPARGRARAAARRGGHVRTRARAVRPPFAPRGRAPPRDHRPAVHRHPYPPTGLPAGPRAGDRSGRARTLRRPGRAHRSAHRSDLDAAADHPRPAHRRVRRLRRRGRTGRIRRQARGSGITGGVVAGLRSRRSVAPPTRRCANRAASPTTADHPRSAGEHRHDRSRLRRSDLRTNFGCPAPVREVVVVGPLLTTKLHMPRRRRGLVARPRLDDRLSRGDEAALTLVSAPPGFGKTTVLTEWLAAAPGETPSVAWLSLDARDNDPALFWSYLVAALQTVAPEVGAGALVLLQSPQSAGEAVLATLVNDLAAVPGDVVLVLDDYHFIASPEIQGGMTFLLEHLPQHVHLVIAGRADPSMPLARLRGRGELVELRAADLRFTPEEAAAYLTEAMGVALTAADVAALESRTEGWIAALQLAALSMQGRDDVAGFITGFAGDDRYIVDYLVEEVLQRQPEQIRSFLLQTSILSRLSAPLCDAVTGRGDGKEMLEALDRGNLFVVALDDRRRWYRYHHLFSDVLHAHLLDEQPAAVAGLHRRAGDWYEQRGDRSEAIGHALAGGDLTRAADLVELAGPELLKARQEATMRRWLEALPDELIRTRPVLSVGYAGVLMVSGEIEGVE